MFYYKSKYQIEFDVFEKNRMGTKASRVAFSFPYIRQLGTADEVIQ
jgi:hypothetical protein